MTSDHHTTASPQPIPTGTLIAAGGVLAIAAGLLRIPASLIDPDTTGAAVETLYYAIDISLLFTVIAVYVAEPASRSLTGTAGFVIGTIGTGLLIGPEPTNASIDYYTLGATAVTIGFALLAIAWRHSTTFAARTRVAFIGTLLLGAAATTSDAMFIAAGVLFSLGLLDTGRSLITTKADKRAPASANLTRPLT